MLLKIYIYIYIYIYAYTHTHAHTYNIGHSKNVTRECFKGISNALEIGFGKHVGLISCQVSMETAIYLSLSQTITYSFNSMQFTQTKLGAYPH